MKKLAVLGPKGTYSDVACTKLGSPYSIEYYPNIYSVLEQVTEEKDALVPFENTLDGFVMESLDGIIKYNLWITEQVKLDVNFQCISFEKSMEDIHTVYVQFKAYGQCVDYIQKNHLTPIITQSNIESLNLLKETRKTGFAAIIPAHTEATEFLFVEKNIIQSLHNETRFVRISKKMPTQPQQKHFNCSITITPSQDEPGILYSILKVFSEYSINLKAILSRPRKDYMGKYIFYIEVEGEDSLPLEKIQKEIKKLN
ncbi:MAG: ACT domain-containing protein, partial [Anaeroplasmataceae bacterium]|nr:ACT domain-containing protein [Anaeroplasmataceae bacterium]